MNLMSDFQQPHSSHPPLFSSTNHCSLPVQQHPATTILHIESPKPTTPSHRVLPLVSLLGVWITRPAPSASASAVTRQAGRLASPSKVRPDIEARITTAEELEVVSDLLVDLVAEADVQGRVDGGGWRALRAVGVWRLAVRLDELGFIPGLCC